MILFYLAISAFVVAVDMLVVAPVLPTIAAELSIPVKMLGTLSGSYAGAFAITSLFTAPLAERLGRRTLLLLGGLAFTCGNVLCAAVHGYQALLVFRVVTGAGAALVMPSVWASVGALVPMAKLGRAMSVIWTAMALATILGVPISAQLSDAFGWRTMFLVIGVAGALSAAPYAFGVSLGPAAKKQPESYFAMFGRVLGHSGVRRALLSTLFWNMSLFGMFAFLGTFYHDRFGVAPRSIGFYILLGGVGNFVASAMGGKLGDTFGARRLVRAGAVLAAFGVALMAQGFALVPSIVLQVIWSAALGLGAASLSSTVVSQMPSARGTVMSLNSFCMNAGVVLGAVVGGSVLAGLPGSYWLLGLLSAASALLVTVTVPGTPGAAPAPAPATSEPLRAT